MYCGRPGNPSRRGCQISASFTPPDGSCETDTAADYMTTRCRNRYSESSRRARCRDAARFFPIIILLSKPYYLFPRHSDLAAYVTWLVVNLALLCLIPLLLRRRLVRLGKAVLNLWLLACLALFPIFVALIQGQDSILLLFLYCLACADLERGSELAAGTWLASGLYKYHLVLPFVLPLWRRKKLMAGFLSVAVILGFISLAVTGWQGLLGYPRYVWGTEHDLKYVLNSPHGNTANLRGLIAAVVPVSHPEIRTGLIVSLSAIVLAISCWQ